MTPPYRAWRSVFLSVALIATPGLAAHAEETVNIYSYREPKLIEPLLKAFTDKTGITPNVVYANTGLIERIAAEGKNSPADVLLSNEFG